MEGILLIVRLCLRQKQKLLRFERFRRGAITDPMFLKAQQCEEGRDRQRKRQKHRSRSGWSTIGSRSRNYGRSNDLRKTQPLEPKLTRAAFPIVPAYLIVQALFDVLVGGDHLRVQRMVLTPSLHFNISYRLS
jgi:hypothetical protein